MRLALFGGSFDPPHIGHVHVVLEAISTLDIEKLIIIPAYRNPFKNTICASGAKRLEWLKTIFEPYPKVTISDFEIVHQRPVYTIETVEHYQKGSNEIYLIIGADNLATLNQWYRYDDLIKKVHFVIASRDNILIPDGMFKLAVNEPISSTNFRTTFTSLGLDETVENEIITYYKEHYEPTH